MMRLLLEDRARVESRLAWRLTVAVIAVAVAVLAIVTLEFLDR